MTDRLTNATRITGRAMTRCGTSDTTISIEARELAEARRRAYLSLVALLVLLGVCALVPFRLAWLPAALGVNAGVWLCTNVRDARFLREQQRR